MLITDYYFIIGNHIIVALNVDIDFRILFDLGDRKFGRFVPQRYRNA